MKKKIKTAAKQAKTMQAGLKKADKMDTGKVKSQKGMKSIKEPC